MAQCIPFSPKSKGKLFFKLKDIWDIFKMRISINIVFPMRKLHRMLNAFCYIFSNSPS